ncbi:galactosylceramide sulfotransferase-like [Uloborus diversus]|uniref:galactosylceramide sulfotransferase-like n=1 Tax=Uloborus diversus TaxID=327109 RepID=UPI0024092A72|nr:galactosylceramide sulfotransferase-like [Uloborus diversus]XP_054712862.1 galactosylceramide sulfotransferase-like [Uloborus diversus]
MFWSGWPSFLKRCPQTISRLLLLTLATLGILGFLINMHLSLISSVYGVCFPKTNIVFLKTHKCAGSSIQNILMRYGDNHNLTFVLPKDGNYLGHPEYFNKAMVAWPRLPSYNILAHHTRFSYYDIRSLMPWNSIYITIVRDPVEIFESSYAYYGLDKFFGEDIHSFIRKLPKDSEKVANRRYREKFGVNQMMFDLGADPKIFNNDFSILRYISKLDSWFDLVLVADRMDESLVLLRNLLCWDIDDVVTFKLNARNPKFKSKLNDNEKAKLRAFNRADDLLYKHFLEKFKRQIDAFDKQRLSAEIAELNRKTQNWYDLCVKGEKAITTPSSKPKYYYNPRVMILEPKSNSNNITCKSMTMEELPYTDILRNKQMTNLPRTYRQLLLRSRMYSKEYSMYLSNSKKL